MNDKTPELHSFEHARLALPRAYKLGKFALPTGTTPGELIAGEYGTDLSGQRLAALFCLVDEMTALLRFLSIGLLIAAADGDKDAAIFHRICVKAVANLASIRSLCALGFDGNARIQLRLHYETMVLWSRLQIDPVAREAFAAADTFEAANRFWRENLAYRKSEKFIEAAIAKGGGIWLGFAEEFADRLAPILGVSSHPSNVEMGFNARQDWEGVLPDRYLVRRVTEASHFTLGSAIWICAFPFIVGGPQLHHVKVPRAWRPPEEDILVCAEEGADYYLTLQEMIPKLFLFAQPFIGGLTPSVEA